MIEFTQLKRIVEAALLAAAQPLSLPQLSALFDETQTPSHDDLARALDELGQDCAHRGVELREVASGFRYQIREDVHTWVARLWTERQTKYSRALLETLALIAYRQPITRGEIEQIRGVAVSTNIIKTLEEREWARVVGYRDVPGKPALFGTTRTFLDYFNLKSLDELPPLTEIRDIEDFDPQLTLGPVAMNRAEPEEEVEHAISSTLHDNSHDTAANAAPASLPALDGAPDTNAASDTDAAAPEHSA
ncbi:MAG: SMC-Scp complex subunit ScpB [Rudaea sp.]|nr:SMC-Scp complex subunit ScpB [Rudaea sp.]